MTVGMQNATEKVAKKRVKYTGDDALKRGYPLCYNRDSTTGDSAGAVDMSRAWEVEKPTTARLEDFAGLVARDYPAVTGGQMIEIVEPRGVGTVVTGYCKVSCTLGTTRLGIKNGTYALMGVSSAIPAIGIANQTVDRSSTPGEVQIILEGISHKIDEAAVVTATQAAVTDAVGATTGATAALQMTDLTAPVGGTTGATAALQMTDLTDGGGTTGASNTMAAYTTIVGGSVGQIASKMLSDQARIVNRLNTLSDDFARVVNRINILADDDARLTLALNAVGTDVAAILSSLITANIMSAS